ncbi:MAG: hypothetical protein JXB36_13230 [Gammaproteobacteria bacterium]|nr:hypothetical protein [Gammaproteobacteria bacterium]
MTDRTRLGALVAAAALGALLTGAAPALAQRFGPQPPPPGPPRESAPIDLTGQWVAVVNEDWRWRMVTPPKGDYASVPLNPEGRRVADTWEPSRDGACEAYGAAALLRMPTRVRIEWQDEDTLRLQTDAGAQTRLLEFTPPEDERPRSLQGTSVAEWIRPAPPPGGPGLAGAGGGASSGGGHLAVTTTDLLPGWLRRNGVPYSQDAVVTEYFDRFAAPNGDEWLMVTTIVDDPAYLNTRYVTSSHFKREDDDSKWNPVPCRAR